MKKLNHIGTKKLETKNLILRKLTLSDLSDIDSKLISDKEIVEFMSWHDKTQIIEEIKEIITSGYEKNQTYYWAIELCETNEFIGVIYVKRFHNEKRIADINGCIDKKHRKCGYGLESLNEVITFLIEKIGFHRIEGVCNMNNKNSVCVMEKAGMTREGVLRGTAINLDENGNPEDLIIYSILSNDKASGNP